MFLKISKILFLWLLFFGTSYSQRVIIALAGSYQSEPYIVQSFIAGYESDSVSKWQDSIEVREWVNPYQMLPLFRECLEIGKVQMVLRNTGVGDYYNDSLRDFYNLGIALVACGGSNNYHSYTFHPSWFSHPIICGAGLIENVTSYYVEFYAPHPFFNDIQKKFYQSYSHAYIAGQLLCIADRLNISIHEARLLARATGSSGGKFEQYNGYGRIDINKAVR